MIRRHLLLFLMTAALAATALTRPASAVTLTAYSDQTAWENALSALSLTPTTETFDGLNYIDMTAAGSPYVINGDLNLTVVGGGDAASITGGDFFGSIAVPDNIADEHIAYVHNFAQPIRAFGQSYTSAASGLGLRLEAGGDSIDIFDDGGYTPLDDGFFGFIASDPVSSVSVVGSDANGSSFQWETYTAQDVSYAIPEPTTTALLGLGGLALLLRRRHA